MQSQDAVRWCWRDELRAASGYRFLLLNPCHTFLPLPCICSHFCWTLQWDCLESLNKRRLALSKRIKSYFKKIIKAWKKEKNTRKYVRTGSAFWEAMCHGIKPAMPWKYTLKLVMPCQSNMAISWETLKKGNLDKITSATYQYLSLQTSEVIR